MRREPPSPDAILEELADKVALQIDRFAPVAFEAALNELIRYHRFLLNVYASRAPDGKAFSYAAVPGRSLRAPHDKWIGQYRRLFERAANRIGDDANFIIELAHVPLRLLPQRDDPSLSDEVIRSIVDLGPILVHRLEAWLTKRTVVENSPGEVASPRIGLAGSDAKSYANLLLQIVGAWERLLQTAPAMYRWQDERGIPESDQQWRLLGTSWPFLWQHLSNTAYMLAVAVWNEDEAGTALFCDALVRWPQLLSYQFSDHVDLVHRRLLFPDIVTLDWAAAIERVKPVLPDYMPVPTANELFRAALRGAHDDVVLLTAALLLFWSMNEKQASDIGAKTAAKLLRRELEEEYATDERARDRKFGSLLLDIVRLAIAGDRNPKGTYGADLDRLVETLDNMTERRVVPGRVFTPSTLHGRDGLEGAFLAMLLAQAPESDSQLVKRIQDLAKHEGVLPAGDQSLRDVLRCLDQLSNMLDASLPFVQRGANLLRPELDIAARCEGVKSTLGSLVDAIGKERTESLLRKPIDTHTLESLRDGVERAMLTPRGVPFFRGFAIERSMGLAEGEPIISRFKGLSKAQFVDPPMEPGSLGFAEFYAKLVSENAGKHVWASFGKMPREKVSVASKIEDQRFWEKVRDLAAAVGPEPLLVVSRRAEGRALRKFFYQRQIPPAMLKIERRVGAETTGASYIANFEGIDVYAAEFEPGNAWLFSPYSLQSIKYAMLEDEHFLNVSFDLEDDLKGSLVAKFNQQVEWADWQIYDIECEDPDDAE